MKYAVLLSWLVYAAGLTRISGFLRTLSIPTEPSSYAFSTVLSYGAYSLLDMLETAGIPIVFLKLSQKLTPRQIWRFIGWAMPAGIFVLQNYKLFWSSGHVSTRSHYALYFLAVAYTLVYLSDGSNIAKVYESPVGAQVLLAAVLFYLVAEGSGYKGDLEAYDAMHNLPSIQFLLAPEAVSGANKLGIPFSASETGLTAPLNVVAVSEKMFYVRIPLLDASLVQNGIRLDWERQITVAIPRDKVIMASTRR